MITKRQITILAVAAAMIATTAIVFGTMKDSGNRVTKNPGRTGQREGGSGMEPKRETFTVTIRQFNQTITVTGKAEAMQSMELTPTVAGSMLPGTKPFREGQMFKKGETLFRIDQGTFGYDLRAKRSSFHTQILKILPELAIDFPESSRKWEQVAQKIRPDSPLPELPEPASERERMVLVAREIYSSYWTIKGLESKQEEYTIRAPFDGVVTAALATGRTYLTAGRNVGTFTGNNRYEIALPVPAIQAGSITVGQAVPLTVLESGRTIDAKIERINRAIDQSSRTVKIYAIAQDRSLMEGSFVTATLKGEQFDSAAIIPARFMVDGSSVKVRTKEGVQIRPVNVIARLDSGVVVTGLSQRTVLTR